MGCLRARNQNVGASTRDQSMSHEFCYKYCCEKGFTYMGLKVASINLKTFVCRGEAVAEWLSSLLAEQEVRGSIPGLANWILVIVYLLLPSRKMADHEIPLKRHKYSIQPTICLSCRAKFAGLLKTIFSTSRIGMIRPSMRSNTP